MIKSFWCLIVLILYFSLTAGCQKSPEKVRIGYFHGGRTMNVYRAFIFGYYDKEKLDVELITRTLRSDVFRTTPKKYEDIMHFNGWGKAKGDELLKLMMEDKVELATIGETSFLKAIGRGEDIVAVAELGFDTLKNPGHLIGLLKGVKAETAEDLKNIRWGARRSSGGDEVILKEFFVSKGIKPSEVRIDRDLAEHKLKKGLLKGKIQGAYFHLMQFQKLYKKGILKMYTPLDWIDPRMSQSVLVVKRSYLNKNRETVLKILKALKKRTMFENSLSLEERLKRAEGTYAMEGLQMERRFLGILNLPQFRNHPTVRVEILEKMQDLLLKHNVIKNKTDISKYIDNSLLNSISD